MMTQPWRPRRTVAPTAPAETDEATRELLAIPGFEERFREAKRQIAAGDVVPWEQVKTPAPR